MYIFPNSNQFLIQRVLVETLGHDLPISSSNAEFPAHFGIFVQDPDKNNEIADQPEPKPSGLFSLFFTLRKQFYP